MRVWININLLQICSWEKYTVRDVLETSPRSPAGREGKARLPFFGFAGSSIFNSILQRQNWWHLCNRNTDRSQKQAPWQVMSDNMSSPRHQLPSARSMGPGKAPAIAGDRSGTDLSGQRDFCRFSLLPWQLLVNQWQEPKKSHLKFLSKLFSLKKSLLTLERMGF